MANPINQRIYYPINAVGFARLGTALDTPSGYRAAKGVQQVGLNTNFSLEQIYQLGQLSLYENIENLPEIELTLEKVADGYSLIQHLATPQAVAASLAGRYNDQQCMAVVAYYPITNEAASGTPLSYMQISGAYVSSLGWQIPVEGNITESVTITARDKQWFYAPSGSPWASGRNSTGASGRIAGPFTGNDSPITASGGVQRRENVVMASCLWPSDIRGTVGNVNVTGADGQFAAHIQNVNVSVNLGRTDLFELGRRGPYFRFATFPTEVTCSIEITATEFGDSKNAFQEQENLTDEPIKIVLTDGTIINLGTKNKLASISQTGGDTGGGNVTITYNYSNFNDYVCTNFVTDPAGLSG